MKFPTEWKNQSHVPNQIYIIWILRFNPQCTPTDFQVTSSCPCCAPPCTFARCRSGKTSTELNLTTKMLRDVRTPNDKLSWCRLQQKLLLMILIAGVKKQQAQLGGAHCTNNGIYITWMYIIREWRVFHHNLGCNQPRTWMWPRKPCPAALAASNFLARMGVFIVYSRDFTRKD